jgi:alpha-galactosidase
MKIVLIGAGSREFSMGLINDLLLETELLHEKQVHLVLVDIDSTSLAVMYNYAKRALALMVERFTVSATVDRKEALEDADYVLLAVELKRMELWEQDFRIPLSFGFKQVYGENGGPGALFHTMRNFQNVFPILRDCEEICPDALVINFTNPEARMLSLILSQTQVKAIGLCHGFYDFYHFVSRVLDRDWHELHIVTAGMNHLFTFLEIVDKHTQEDLLPVFLEKVSTNPQLLPPLCRYLFDTLGIIGIDSDHHVGEYFSFAHEFVGLQWEFGIEKREVLNDSRYVDAYTHFQAWRHRVGIREYLDRELGMPFEQKLDTSYSLKLEEVVSSGELAIPVIADIELDRKSWRPAVNVLNQEAYIENLSIDACVEVPAMVDAQGVHPTHIGSLGEGFAEHIRIQNAIQKLCVEGFMEKSRKKLIQALLLDPITDSAIQTERCFDYMWNLQKEYLFDLE